jgi:hypothetical protein
VPSQYIRRKHIRRHPEHWPRRGSFSDEVST